MSTLKCGKADIGSLLSQLPPTKHVYHSFTLDVTVSQVNMLHFKNESPDLTYFVFSAHREPWWCLQWRECFASKTPNGHFQSSRCVHSIERSSSRSREALAFASSTICCIWIDWRGIKRKLWKEHWLASNRRRRLQAIVKWSKIQSSIYNFRLLPKISIPRTRWIARRMNELAQFFIFIFLNVFQEY